MPIKLACELTEDESQVPLRLAAEMAAEADTPVTLVGLRPSGRPIFCCGSCQLSHPGSVVVIPDSVTLELCANGWDECKTGVLTRTDGRSVWIYKVPT